MAKEINYPYSDMIISLLHKAYKYFRGAAHKRRILHIACLLADEHFVAGSYELALKFYSEISYSKGLKLWMSILYHVRSRAIECSKQLELHSDVVRHSLSLIRTSPKVSKRSEIFQRALKQLSKLKEEEKIVFDMGEQGSFVEVFVDWESLVVAFDKEVVALVTLKSFVPVKFERLTVELNSTTHVSDPMVLSKTVDEDIEIAEGESKTITLNFGVISVPLSKLSVAKVSLIVQNTQSKLQLQSLDPPSAVLSIGGRQAMVQLLCKEAPDLWIENDLSRVCLAIANGSNEQSLDILRGRLIVEYHDAVTGRTVPVSNDLAIPLLLQTKEMGETNKVDIGIIEKGQTVEVEFLLQFVKFGDHNITIRLDYETSDYITSSKLALSAKVHRPFQMKFQFHRDTMHAIPSRNCVMWVGRNTMVSMCLENLCSVPLEVSSMECEFADTECLKKRSKNVFPTTVLEPHTQFTWWESFEVLSMKSMGDHGSAVIKWKRENGLDIVTKYKLPSFQSVLDSPSSAYIGESFQVIVRVVNHSNLSHQMFLFTRERRLNAEVQGYVFTGPKTLHFTILPKCVWEAKYLVVPLLVGELPLPSFVIKSKRDNSTVEGSDQGRTLSVHIRSED